LESFEPFTDVDPSFINYGTIRVTKKSRNVFVLSGTAELKRSMGNEIIVSIFQLNFQQNFLDGAPKKQNDRI
jgi:hypothetical protein